MTNDKHPASGFEFFEFDAFEALVEGIEQAGTTALEALVEDIDRVCGPLFEGRGFDQVFQAVAIFAAGVAMAGGDDKAERVRLLEAHKWMIDKFIGFTWAQPDDADEAATKPQS